MTSLAFKILEQKTKGIPVRGDVQQIVDYAHFIQRTIDNSVIGALRGGGPVDAPDDQDDLD